MRTALLSLVFLAGTASALSAAPGREETTARISYSTRRPRAPANPAADPGWIQLASATPASHGREFIVVDSDAGRLSYLRLTVATGRPEIWAVQVAFQDGTRRTFPVDQTLGPRRPSAYIDLRGARAIAQVIVITDRGSRGSYVLEASAGSGGVAMRGPAR
jgi:hypothetical protein